MFTYSLELCISSLTLSRTFYNRKGREEGAQPTSSCHRQGSEAWRGQQGLHGGEDISRNARKTGGWSLHERPALCRGQAGPGQVCRVPRTKAARGSGWAPGPCSGSRGASSTRNSYTVSVRKAFSMLLRRSERQMLVPNPENSQSSEAALDTL